MIPDGQSNVVVAQGEKVLHLNREGRVVTDDTVDIRAPGVVDDGTVIISGLTYSNKNAVIMEKIGWGAKDG